MITEPILTNFLEKLARWQNAKFCRADLNTRIKELTKLILPPIFLIFYNYLRKIKK